MRMILVHFDEVPLRTLGDGEVLLREGEKTGHIFALAEGRLEVLRGETQVALLEDPGSLIGEMAVLLDSPHTATVRAVGPTKVHAVADGAGFLASHPGLSWLVARLLARRLNAATTYLVDIKRQFTGTGNHLELVGEVLETLMHQQGLDTAQQASERDGYRD
jgi:CRP/FNR family transcriptional regulator, cyclic AMP receptor protein